MEFGSESCPHCGKPIIKGAMRCMGCGKILKTAAEQQRSIDRYKETQETSFFAKLFKFFFFAVVILVLAVAYKLFGNEIRHFISAFVKK